MSDYETAQRRRNIIVGIFVLIGIGAFVWLIFKFGDLPTKVAEWRSFKVIVQLSAGQVGKSAPVRFCGYPIGKVTDVKRPKVLKDLKTGRFYHQTVVILSIDRKYDDIPYNSEVRLMTRGLGSSYIDITAPLPDPNRPVTKFLEHGSLVQGSTGATSELFPAETQKKLEKLVDGLTTLVSSANNILGDKTTQEKFKSGLVGLSEVAQQAAQTIKEFQELSAAGTTVLKNVDTRMEKVVTAIVGASEELSKTVAQTRVILEKINSGQGTAGKLINDGRLYESLLENSQQMEVLLQELRSFIAELPDKGIPIKLK